jgi:hypothetical protein
MPNKQTGKIAWKPTTSMARGGSTGGDGSREPCQNDCCHNSSECQDLSEWEQLQYVCQPQAPPYCCYCRPTGQGGGWGHINLPDLPSPPTRIG